MKANRKAVEKRDNTADATKLKVKTRGVK